MENCIVKGIDYRPYLREGETPFGSSGSYLYVYKSNHRVMQFKVERSAGGHYYRRNQLRFSPDYIMSLRNTVDGRTEYKRVRDALKVIYPGGRVVRLGRGPRMATATHGTVKMEKATHFDVYVRNNA